MSAHVQRALLLLQQGRPAEAEREARGALAENPESPDALAVLAHALSEQERHDEAQDAAQRAIGVAPDWDYAHYVHAEVLVARDEYAEAEKAAIEALRIVPDDPDYHALLARINFARRNWGKALEAAERGLELDSEHQTCSNLRAMALVKLGRKEQAGEGLEEQLARDPENALTHANMGWTLLEKGNHRQATEHFREALRLQPDMEWAREGILTALKARSRIYRLVLKYYLFMSRLSDRAGWGIIIGAYVLYRVMRSVAKSSPEAAPFLYPVIGLYILFAMLTWMANPLFNLTLRVHPLGKHALTQDQITASNLTGAALLIAIAAVGVALWTGYGPPILVAFMFGVLVIPIAGTFNVDEGRGRLYLGLYLAVLFALILTSMGLMFSGHGAGVSVAILYFLGVFVFSWVANFVAFRQR